MNVVTEAVRFRQCGGGRGLGVPRPRCNRIAGNCARRLRKLNTDLRGGPHPKRDNPPRFPSIKLTAQYGGQSGAVLNLVNTAARFYAFGPQITWGLLNYPATKANIRTYEAKRDQQYLTYQKTVLTAFQEVEDALVSYNKEKERHAALDEEVTQLQKAADVAMTRYTRGLTSFLDVLDAQRSLFNEPDSRVESRAALRINLITLYKALGGGWERNDPVARSETVPMTTTPN